jgi:hypothetical protein
MEEEGRFVTIDRLQCAVVLGVCSGVVASSAMGGIRRHDVDDAQYLALAQQSQFGATARFQIFTDAGTTRTCSGTLIADQWILTAAHCTTGATNAGSYIAQVGNEFGFAEQVIVHPEWNANNITAGFDLALVKLSSPILNTSAAAMYSGSGELGMVGTGVGYGATGTGLFGELFGTQGMKRAGTNVIDALGSDRGWNESLLITDFDSPLRPEDSTYGDSSPTALEYQVAGGDSGGSLFIETQAGWVLAGVTSFINSVDGDPDGDYGDMSVYTRVSDYEDWIRSVIPAPGSGVVLVGALGMLARRRRGA